MEKKNIFSNIRNLFDFEEDNLPKKSTSAKNKKVREQHEEKVNKEPAPNIPSNIKEEQYEEKDRIKKRPIFEGQYSPLQKKKLVIIVLENTIVINEQLIMVSKIVNSIRMSELVCIINYGSVVTISDIIDTSDLNKFPLLNSEDIGEKAHLYDAILKLENLISKKYLGIEVRKEKRLMIDSIEIIGIGTCKDNGSMHLKEAAQNSFYQVASKPKITTKYFCLTEQNMVSAAEMGFRSIGAILRSF